MLMEGKIDRLMGNCVCRNKREYIICIRKKDVECGGYTEMMALAQNRDVWRAKLNRSKSGKS